MRKILIDKNLENKVNDFSKNLFISRTFIKPIVKLELLKKRKGFKSVEKIKYIDKIINEYQEILKAKPNKITELCNEFDKIINHKNIQTKFWMAIVECLRYNDLRDKEYLNFANDLQFKTCFYCNAQLTVIIPIEYFKTKKLKGQIKSRKATFELDHVKAKSKYPFLATSFFNLIPSCSICNKAKSNKDIEFNFFEENSEDLDFLDFKLDQKSLQKYDITKNKDDFDFSFDIKGVDKTEYNNTFKIQEIYETQKDVIEELYYLKKIYNHGHKLSLTNILKDKGLFPDEAFIDRLVISNYSKPNEFHKRPFAKFTQDIARQLELIK